MRYKNIECPSITEDGECTLDSGSLCVCLSGFCQCGFSHRHLKRSHCAEAEAEEIADALKPDAKVRLIKLIEQWFDSDLDIDFTLIDGEERLYCKFESDAYYWQGRRFSGQHRRFIGIEGSDSICDLLRDEFHTLYTKEELIDLVHLLAENFEISLED